MYVMIFATSGIILTKLMDMCFVLCYNKRKKALGGE